MDLRENFRGPATSTVGRSWAAPLLVGLLGLVPLASSCSGSGSKTPKVLGSMPQASTTAVPEWLPERVFAGAAIPDDSREKHLFDARRLTSGWAVKEVAWAPDSSCILILATPPGAPTPGVFKVSIQRDAPEPARISRPEDTVSTMTVVAHGTDPWTVLYATGNPASLVELDSKSGVARSVDVAGVTIDGLAASPKGPVYFVGHDAKSNSALYTMGKLGGPVQPLSSDEVAAVGPALSPDDAYLAFGRKKRAAGAGVVARSSVEGRSVADLASVGADYAVRNVTFHPSGKWLVFSSDRDRREFDLYAIDVSDASREPTVQRLTFSRADAPAFSADGRSLAFSSQREGPSRDLYVARFIEEL